MQWRVSTLKDAGEKDSQSTSSASNPAHYPDKRLHVSDPVQGFGSEQYACTLRAGTFFDNEHTPSPAAEHNIIMS